MTGILALVPLLLALVDDRSGFRLVMLSLALYAGMLVANLLVHTLGLPTMGGRLLEWGPYALGLVSLVGLVREFVALRTPLGLLVDGRGLHGVRGSASIEASWDEIDTVDVVGPHGPKLAISIVGQTPVIIDAHRLGSDPASVVRVLAFFRDHPDQRPSLADGMTAMQIVTGELQP